MKSSRPRIFQWVLLGLLAVGITLVFVFLFRFEAWRSVALKDLDEGSAIQKTMLGHVEAVLKGTGPTVLIFHATPGGYDQALLFGEDFVKSGYQVVAPSRPGYLRTPLSVGILPEQQADAMAAVLDLRDLQDVSVIGYGGGAPAAILFAKRHPERTRSLALVSPVLNKYVPGRDPEQDQAGKAILTGVTGDIGSWMTLWLAKHQPGWLLSRMIARQSSAKEIDQQNVVQEALQNPEQLAQLRGLVQTIAPLGPREVGARIDILNERSLPDDFPQKVDQPVLLISSRFDKNQPFAAVEAFAKKCPNAKIVETGAAGPYVFFGKDAGKTRQELLDFLSATRTAPSHP